MHTMLNPASSSNCSLFSTSTTGCLFFIQFLYYIFKYYSKSLKPDCNFLSKIAVGVSVSFVHTAMRAFQASRDRRKHHTLNALAVSAAMALLFVLSRVSAEATPGQDASANDKSMPVKDSCGLEQKLCSIIFARVK